jgi:hypothetical protein
MGGAHDAAAGLRWRLANHLCDLGFCAGDEFGNEARFRQVPPIPPGHLAPHQGGVQPRGVEDRGVIGAPDLLQGVLGRRVRRIGAGREGEALHVPMDADVRGQDGKPHVGEPPGEEGRDKRAHPMRRLEPGDVGRLPVGVLEPAKPDEGLHLVRRLIDLAGEAARLGDIGVAGDAQQVRLAPQPCEQTVEQVETLVRAMQHHRFRKLHELARDTERGRFGLATD